LAVPSVLVVRLSGGVADIEPRWLLAAAAAICEGASSDHRAQFKPFSVGRVVPDGEGVAVWRLGWLGDLGLPVGWPPSAVRFGAHQREVLGFDGRGMSYAELARGGPMRRARFTMTSPLFFSRNGRDLPLPEPVLAVRGLLARWNAWAPEPLRVAESDAKALAGAVYLDEVVGASEKVELGGGLRQVGFVGSAEFRLLAAVSEQTAALFGALVRFAAYAGLGAQTTAGFGSVDVMAEAPRPRPAARGRTAAPAAGG
jgi:CRISPR-associated endoribonuclease Cas6